MNKQINFRSETLFRHGSASLTTDSSGQVLSELRYTPAHRVLREGKVRYNAGTTPTDYTYTGQYSNTADFGLMFYNARWYDPYLGRMAQADMIIPPGVQGLDRYAYVNNSPMNFVDPTGHVPCDEYGICNDRGKQVIHNTNYNHMRLGGKKQELFDYIEGTYAVDLDGPWTTGALEILQSALDKYAKAVGGAGKLNSLFNQIEGGIFYSEDDRIPFVYEKGTTNFCGEAFACWDGNSIHLHEYAFTSGYLENYLGVTPGIGSDRRPTSLGLDTPNMSSQVTIAHEITHAMADLFPSAALTYALNVDDAKAFGGSWEESMASSIAIFVISEGKTYAGYEDQTHTSGGLLSAWK